MTTSTPSLASVPKNRGWLIWGGILSLIVGFLAISFPLLFSIVITQLIGAFALVSGVIALFMAIFGHHTPHRVMQAVSAIIRIAAGLALLFFALAGVATLTLILAIIFITEGIISIISAFKMRPHSGWGFLLLNGIIALVLGGMVYAHWPNDSGWILGLLYGINSIFSGTSMLMLGLGTPKAA
jgi:uncharacterized membrane protein HdeD (DUF308 family)